jgi:hypothetical protein
VEEGVGEPEGGVVHASGQHWHQLGRDDAHKTRGFLAKFLPVLRTSTTVQAATVRVTATLPVAFAADATGRAVDMSSVEAQLAALWKEVDAVRFSSEERPRRYP